MRRDKVENTVVLMLDHVCIVIAIAFLSRNTVRHPFCFVDQEENLAQHFNCRP